MASLTRRPNGRWRPRYRDAADKEHARHFERKADAQAWLDSVTTSVLTGAYVDPKRTRVSVAEWAGQWLESKVDLKPTTHRCYEVSLRVHILPTWGPVRLGDITHQGVAAWVAALSRSGKSASTVRHAHRVLSLILGLAVRHGRLARNPAVGVPLPRTVRGEQIFLTHAQPTDGSRTEAGCRSGQECGMPPGVRKEGSAAGLLEPVAHRRSGRRPRRPGGLWTTNEPSTAMGTKRSSDTEAAHCHRHGMCTASRGDRLHAAAPAMQQTGRSGTPWRPPDPTPMSDAINSSPDGTTRGPMDDSGPGSATGR